MKKFALSLALVFAAGTLFAQATQAPPAKPPESKADAQADAATKAPLKTHKLEAEVVAADVEKKTLTFKEGGAEKTAPVGALAMYRLKQVKAGDKVTLTCKDGDTPADCKEVTFIKMAAAPAASKKPDTPQ